MAITEESRLRWHPRHGLASIAVLAGLLAGCAGTITNPQVAPPGSPAFQEAYVQGCWTGYVDAGRDGVSNLFRKDATRYQQDPDYRTGWDQGYHACYEDEIRYPRMLGGDSG